MKTLREMTDDIAEIKRLAESHDLPEEAAADTLEGLEGIFKDKAVRVGAVILDYESDIAAIDLEIKRLQKRKTQKAGSVDFLREYLITNMVKTDTKKIEDPLLTITLPKPRAIVVVDDQDALPAGYKVEKPATFTPDKRAIMETLKAGLEVPGAHMDDGKQGVTIK